MEYLTRLDRPLLSEYSLSNTEYKDSLYPLTMKEYKGFMFEVESYGHFVSIPSLGIVKCNPLEPLEWKRHNAKGVDSILSCYGYTISVECKKNDAQVYPSYIERDFIPRFKGVKGIRVVLTSNVGMYSRKCIDLLRRHSILLFDMPLLRIFVSGMEMVTRSLCDNITRSIYGNRSLCGISESIANTIKTTYNIEGKGFCNIRRHATQGKGILLSHFETKRTVEETIKKLLLSLNTEYSTCTQCVQLEYSTLEDHNETTKECSHSEHTIQYKEQCPLSGQLELHKTTVKSLNTCATVAHVEGKKKLSTVDNDLEHSTQPCALSAHVEYSNCSNPELLTLDTQEEEKKKLSPSLSLELERIGIGILGILRIGIFRIGIGIRKYVYAKRTVGITRHMCDRHTCRVFCSEKGKGG